MLSDYSAAIISQHIRLIQAVLNTETDEVARSHSAIYFGILFVFLISSTSVWLQFYISVCSLNCILLFVCLSCVVLFGLMATRLNKHYYITFTSCWRSRLGRCWCRWHQGDGWLRSWTTRRPGRRRTTWPSGNEPQPAASPRHREAGHWRPVGTAAATGRRRHAEARRRSSLSALGWCLQYAQLTLYDYSQTLDTPH